MKNKIKRFLTISTYILHGSMISSFWIVPSDNWKIYLITILMFNSITKVIEK
jgi:hypothetical protein